MRALRAESCRSCLKSHILSEDLFSGFASTDVFATHKKKVRFLIHVIDDGLMFLMFYILSNT